MENKLDGNAAAGILQAIFPFDMAFIRVAQVKGRYLLDMQGVRVLQMKEG